MGPRGHFPQQVWLWAAWKCRDVVGQGQLQGHGDVGVCCRWLCCCCSPECPLPVLLTHGRDVLCHKAESQRPRSILLSARHGQELPLAFLAAKIMCL